MSTGRTEYFCLFWRQICDIHKRVWNPLTDQHTFAYDRHHEWQAGEGELEEG